MRLLRRCMHELWTLFVDDGMAAAFVVGWILLACLVLRRVSTGLWSGPILFAGLTVIVAVSTLQKRS